MEKTVLVFGHTDLDGVGVQIVGRKYAQSIGLPCEVFKCNYHEVNQKIIEAFQKYTPDEVAEVLIGDISVNEDVAHLLCRIVNRGVKVTLRDHHATAEWLNKYDWAYVAEKEDGVPFCGTYLLSREFPSVFDECKVFIETVDSWDVWKWKNETPNNPFAKDLNALFQIMGTRNFTDYIMSLDMSQVQKPEDLFNDYSRALIQAQEMMVMKTARSCESSMWTGTFSFPKHPNKKIQLMGGIVFCNHDTSGVADYILDNHKELDFLMLVGLPRSLSFRTQKKLPIPLGDVAKFMTGSGGGHPQAAGSVISANQFKKVFMGTMSVLNNNSTVRVDNLKLSQTQMEDN